MVLPAANASDLELLPEEVLENVTFTQVRTMDEVMDAALTHRPLRTRPQEGVGPELGAPLTHG